MKKRFRQLNLAYVTGDTGLKKRSPARTSGFYRADGRSLTVDVTAHVIIGCRNRPILEIKESTIIC